MHGFEGTEVLVQSVPGSSITKLYNKQSTSVVGGSSLLPVAALAPALQHASLPLFVCIFFLHGICITQLLGLMLQCLILFGSEVHMVLTYGWWACVPPHLPKPLSLRLNPICLALLFAAW
jgi:hypothetical protein